MVDEHTVFEIVSITKLFTAQLMEKGPISSDATIDEYLPKQFGLVILSNQAGGHARNLYSDLIEVILR